MTHKGTTIVKEYFYDSEEEKQAHSKEMEESGYADSGQVNKNVGSMQYPDWRLFGRYYKYEGGELSE